MKTLGTTVLLLIFATLAAVIAQYIGLPLPFLLGPLLSCTMIAAGLPDLLPQGYSFPGKLRLIFIGVIGMMIGAQITPDLLRTVPRLWPGFCAIIIFVTLCHSWNYIIFRKLGKYDKPTAFYASSPGGLYESLSMGEDAGAEPTRLMLQQFLRVILVVTLLPIGLSFWFGIPVGSAAGMTLAQDNASWTALPIVAMTVTTGIVLGNLLRLPAKQLTGPMVAAAILSLSGAVSAAVPQPLVDIAQVVVGASLGLRFSGLHHKLILRGATLSLISVGGMLFFAGLFALLLNHITGLSYDTLLISFAPGGVTEMALVALSLDANPALVTLYHIWRILVTVIGLGISAKFFHQTQ